MRDIEVERTDWKPDEKRQQPEALPEGVRVIEGDARLVDPDGNVVAVVCEPNRADLGRLAWVAREILAQNYWVNVIVAEGSSRLSGMKNTHITFGTTAPQPLRRRYGCSTAAFDRDLPRLASEIRHMATTAWGALQGYAPVVADEVTNAVFPAIHDDWLLFDSPWTSGIINKTSALPYHRDSGNLIGSWSAMYVLRNRVAGGELHLPEYGVAFDCADKSLVMFDGQLAWHGVTPLAIDDHPEAYRYTLVYYAKRACRACINASSEADRAAREATSHDYERTEMLDGLGMREKRDAQVAEGSPGG